MENTNTHRETTACPDCQVMDPNDPFAASWADLGVQTYICDKHAPDKHEAGA